RSVVLRAFEVAGGVDQMRLTLGRPTGVVPIRLVGGANHVRMERPRGAQVQLRLSGGTAGVEFDGQKLGATGGPSLLESTGAGQSADRYSIEVVGGVNRISVVEVAG